MTQLEVHDRATRSAKNLVPTFQWEPKDSLYHMTVFEQEIEDATNGIIKHAAQITLDPNSTTGQYNLPSDFKALDEISWAPDASTRAWWPVVLLTPHSFREAAMELTQLGPGVPLLPPDQSGQLVVMLEYGKLNVLPMSIGGVLTMRYKPHLTPYAPSSSVWTDYVTDPEGTMKIRELDESMSSAFNGIVCYVVAQMLIAQPNGAERFAPEIALNMRTAQRSIVPVARASVEAVHTTPQKLVPFGGMP